MTRLDWSDLSFQFFWGGAADIFTEFGRACDACVSVDPWLSDVESLFFLWVLEVC
jgi:hypothetical protein